MTTPDGGLGDYIRERFRELQQSFDSFATQIRDTTGDHAVRIAKLEMRADLHEQTLRDTRAEHDAEIKSLVEGRRFNLGTWIAAFSALAAIAAVLVAVIYH